MSNFFRIIKINIYSFLALPFLVTAFVSKLIAKAVSKLGTILRMTLLTVVIAAVILLINNPEYIKEHIGTGVIVLVVAGSIIAILRVAFSVVRFILTSIYHAVASLFETLFDLTYSVYVSLYNGCKNDFAYLTLTGPPVIYGILCVAFLLLRLTDFLIMAFINISLILFAVASFGAAAFMYIATEKYVRETFGLDLFTFFSMFDLPSKIMGIVLYLVLVADVFVVLVSLGLEWKKWSDELKINNDDYDDYLDHLEENDQEMEELETDDDIDNEYLITVNSHLDDIEAFIAETREAMSLGDNPLLEEACNEYLCNLSDVSDALADGKGRISGEEMDRLKPYIRKLDRQKKHINKLLEKQYEILDNPAKNTVFFSGCDTREKLERRYKSLCKTYHPDSESGDEETFKILTEEYSRLKDFDLMN